MNFMHFHDLTQRCASGSTSTSFITRGEKSDRLQSHDTHTHTGPDTLSILSPLMWYADTQKLPNRTHHATQEACGAPGLHQSLHGEDMGDSLSVVGGGDRAVP